MLRVLHFLPCSFFPCPHHDLGLAVGCFPFNPLNAELNPICHLLALLGGATIVVVSRLRVNLTFKTVLVCYSASSSSPVDT